MLLIDKNKEKINRLCEQHKVRNLFAFGSVLTDRFNNDSDIDFVVDFDNVDLLEYADNYFDLKFALEDLFNRPVDLLENQAIKNPYLREEIDSHKVRVYG